MMKFFFAEGEEGAVMGCCVWCNIWFWRLLCAGMGASCEARVLKMGIAVLL